MDYASLIIWLAIKWWYILMPVIYFLLFQCVFSKLSNKLCITKSKWPTRCSRADNAHSMSYHIWCKHYPLVKFQSRFWCTILGVKASHAGFIWFNFIFIYHIFMDSEICVYNSHLESRADWLVQRWNYFDFELSLQSNCTIKILSGRQCGQ